MKITKRNIRGTPQGTHQLLGLHMELGGTQRQVALATVFSDGKQPAVRLLEIPSHDMTLQELHGLSGALEAFAVEIGKELERQEAGRQEGTGSRSGSKERSLGSSIDRLMSARDTRTAGYGDAHPQGADSPRSRRAKPGEKQ